MDKRIRELSKVWYQRYVLLYNTPVMSEAELYEHLYRKGFEKGYEIGSLESNKEREKRNICN